MLIKDIIIKFINRISHYLNLRNILTNMYIYLSRGRYIIKIYFCRLRNFMKSKTLLELYYIYLWILVMYLFISIMLLVIS